MTGSDPRADYLRREAEHAAEVDAARRNSLRIGTVRVVTFLALVAALVLSDPWTGTAERMAYAAAVLLAVAFVAEIAVHRRVRRRERWHGTLRGLAREGMLRLDRRWKELDAALPGPERADGPAGSGPARAASPDHPWAHDLDVLGQASLVRLLGPVTSERGRAALRSWLLDPFDPVRSSARQAAVRDLAPEPETRAVVAAHGRLNTPGDAGTVRPFLDWAEQAPWLPGWARLVAWVMPAVLVGLAAGQYLLGWPPFWVVPALIQVEVLRRFWRRVHAELGVVEESSVPLHAYVPQLRLVEAGRWPSAYLAEIRGALGSGTSPASAELRRLARLVDTVSSRRNLFYAILVPLLLLDIHLAAALDGWRRRSGRSVRGWLDALGRWEAVSALATAAYDHPDWSFPRFAADGPPVVRAAGLGHPLLPPSACVRNDVEVGPPGGFLLVTGSNMSGKSTLLRAIGANVVLAGAGGPVCAASLEVPRVRVHTTMRVEDSVTQGVSLFMAELLRIRDVVTAVDEEGEDVPVLYLLDEILHGTNTAERQVAARAVIRHLVARGAIGAVSTHDLTLAEAPDLASAAVSVHFREQVEPGIEGRTRLTFDYLLRPGLATTRNALKLLDAVGLGGLEGLDKEKGPEG